MIPQSISPYSSKGGVGKSTLCVNLAVGAAIAGWKVLTLDLDPQGNLADGFGYDGHPEYDGGASLIEAVRVPDRLLVLRDIRANVDCIPGGPESEGLSDLIASSYARDPVAAPRLLEHMLDPIADEYDLIVVDLPPTPSALHNAAFTMLHWIVVPTATDKFSRGGLASGFRRFGQIHATTNPDLEILACVITRHDLRYPRHLDAALTQFRDVFGDTIPVLEPPIRHNQGADGDMKEHGLGAAEYEALSRIAKRERLAWLKRRKRDGDAAGPPPAGFSKVAGQLAEDYDAVISQLLAMIAESLAGRAQTNGAEPGEAESAPHVREELSRAPAGDGGGR